MITRTTLLTLAVATLTTLAALPAAAQSTLKTDANQSSIQAVGAKVTGDHTLTFSNFDGTITVDKGQVSALSFTLQMKDFTTEMEGEWGTKLVGHLQSPDFFDIERYPTATFKSVSVTPEKSKHGTHMVLGKLTLRGKTRTIRFPATIQVTGGAVSGETEFTINRKDFGIVYTGKPDDLIRDAVLLKVNLKAKR